VARDYARDYFVRNYSSGLDRRGAVVVVPEDVQRVAIHEPCPFCGVARAMCRHRIAA